MVNVLFVAMLFVGVNVLIRWARTKTEIGRIAARLYRLAVDQSRDPDLYARLGAPDTTGGRFGLLVLHLFAVTERLSRAGRRGGRIARATFEAFVADIEGAMHETGIGDSRVPKSVRRAAIAFYDRRDEYRAALEAGDAAALARAIATHVADDADAACGRPLAAYLTAVIERLDRLADGDVVAGALDFPDPRQPAGPAAGPSPAAAAPAAASLAT